MPFGLLFYKECMSWTNETQKKVTDEYRDNWDAIFKAPKDQQNQVQTLCGALYYGNICRDESSEKSCDGSCELPHERAP